MNLTAGGVLRRANAAGAFAMSIAFPRCRRLVAADVVLVEDNSIHSNDIAGFQVHNIDDDDIVNIGHCNSPTSYSFDVAIFLLPRKHGFEWITFSYRLWNFRSF